MRKTTVPSIIILVIIIMLFMTFFLKIQLQQGNALLKGDKSETAKQEQVVLHFIHWKDIPEEIFNSFSKKYPYIKVEFEHYGVNQFRDVQRSRILSGENIDAMGVFEKDYKDFISKGYLTDITNKKFIDNYNSRAIQAVKDMYNNKKVYALPYKSRVWGMWYNKILFNKYNLKVPQNYKEFLNICDKLKSNGIPPMVLGARDEEISSYIYYLSMWNIEDRDQTWFEKLNKGQAKWTDKEMIEVFNKSDQFIKNGYLLSESIELTNHQAFSKFINGQVAMCIMDDWSIDMYQPRNWDLCDPGVFPIPYNESGQNMKIPGTEAGVLIGVCSQSKHKKESELLLDYISETEAAQIYSEEMMSDVNVKGINTDKVKYNDLWEPLRKMEFVEPLTNVLDEDVQKKLNKSAKQLIIQSVKVSDLLKELQQIQESVNVTTK